jgi:hypothetical protein
MVLFINDLHKVKTSPYPGLQRPFKRGELIDNNARQKTPNE